MNVVASMKLMQNSCEH